MPPTPPPQSIRARGVGYDCKPLGFRLEYAALRRIKPVWQRLRPQPTRELILLAGMQRSGTNMLMEVLERSFDTEVVHETDPRAFDDYLMRPPEVIAALRARSAAPVFVIKALCEMQRLASLLDRFAPTRGLWVVRDYRDVVNSMAVSFPRHGRHVAAMAAGESAGWRSEGMSAATRATPRQIYHPELGAPDTAALMWYVRNVLFFEQGFEQDPRVLAVAYEDLVTRPQTAFAHIFEYLGLRLRPWHTRRVVASSVRRRNPPTLDPDVTRLCDGLAERFAAHTRTSS